jgi:pimeloyl-ACP methyl ester carboxylesterase
MTASAGDTGPILARRTLALGSVALDLFEGGDGRTLLFLHDGTGVAPDAPVLRQLASRFRVIAPLNPGFGGTAMPRWMSTVDDFAHVQLELARRLRLDRVILVGASLGAWVAAEMATKNTGNLDRLVLIGPLGIKVGPVDKLDVPDIFAMSRSELDRRLYARPEKWRLDPTQKSDAELAIIAQNWESLALVSWEPYMHNPKLKHRLPSIDRPTLVLRGEEDGLVSSAYAESFAGLIPGARIETIPGAAHLAHVEEPRLVVESIVRFAGV